VRSITFDDRVDPLSDLAFEAMRERRKVTSIEYWRALCPDLAITDEPFGVDCSPYAVTREEADDQLQQLRVEGYCQTRPLLLQEEVTRLRGCVERVVGAGHKPAYALLYDEFYRVLSKLGGVLAPILGPDFRLVPDELSAYHVAADDDATGTRPHRDSLRPTSSIEADGTPTLVNVWITLSDVSPPGSCIYVLPANRDRRYLADTDEDRSLDRDELQSVRAIAASAGSVLVWSTHLLHWGSRSSRRASGPRISFATYFQSSRVPAFHDVTLDIPSPLPFDYRLYLVEKVFRDPRGESREWRRLQKYAR
jgi:Phytanoyl-CoA dioxygenase (PhyH)